MTTQASDLDLMTNTQNMPTITGVSHVDLTVTNIERSVEFYSKLLGASTIFEARSDENHINAHYVIHPDSLLFIGLIEHDGRNSDRFDEQHVGLDHLSFNVSSAEELQAWVAHLDQLGIEHSPVASEDMWDVLVLRDPDNIQLEFFYLKPAATQLLNN